MGGLAWALPAGLLLLTAWYVGVIGRRGRAWQALAETVGQGSEGTITFSVVIAARDEAANLPALLADLAHQQYPVSSFEIIVADDHSTDGTAAVVEAFAATSPVAVRVLRLAELPAVGHGKKAALAAAIGAARHAWIAGTDADCRVGPRWLAALAARIQQQPDIDLLSGPVALRPDGSVFARLQVVEFAGLVGIGAASLALGEPNMCNGANLAYRRDAWHAVNRQLVGRHVASGDDEFLLHTLWARRPGSAAFVKSPEAIVRTAAAPSVGAFLRQRVRWASKWPHYRLPGVQRLAAGVFGLNLLLLVGVLWGWWWPVAAPAIGGAWLAKLLADAWFLRQILRFQGDERHFLAAVLGWQVLYVPYVVLTALLSGRGRYAWKGRRVQ